MKPQILPLGYLILALIHPARPWVRTATTADDVRVFHWQATE